MVRGGISHDEGRAVDGRKPSRQGHAQFGGCQRVGSKAASARQAGHGLAHFEVADPFANGLNHTRVFRTRHKGQLGFHLVFVLNNQQIRKVQTGGLNLYKDLARAGRWCGQFFPGEGVNPDRVLAKPSVHATSP